MNTPSAYRFRPSDEQLISAYLFRRTMGLPFPCNVILETDLYGQNTAPSDIFGDTDEYLSCYWHPECHETKGIIKKTVYVFTKLVKTGPNSSRIARRAGCGTWSGQTGAKRIKNFKGEIIGSKKMFTFEDSNAKKGDHHWIMHEYSLDGVCKNLGSENLNNDLVLCKITRSFEGKPNYNVNNDGIGWIPPPAGAMENISGDVPYDFSSGGVIDQIPQPIEENMEPPRYTLCGNKTSLDEGVQNGSCGSKKPRISGDDDNYAVLLEEQLLADQSEDNNYGKLLENQLLADSENNNADDFFEGLEDFENLFDSV